MPTWQTVSLLVVALAFLALVLYRVRPRMGRRRREPLGPALRAARTKLLAAKSDSDKADALREAGDACATAFGRGEAAASYYLRAMRLAPERSELVVHVCAQLEHRPRVLESLLWRKLALDADRKDTQGATIAALHGLAMVYTLRPRHATRARALEGVLARLR